MVWSVPRGKAVLNPRKESVSAETHPRIFARTFDVPYNFSPASRMDLGGEPIRIAQSRVRFFLALPVFFAAVVVCIPGCEGGALQVAMMR